MDILERLDDAEKWVDAVDDAKQEIVLLRGKLEKLPMFAKSFLCLFSLYLEDLGELAMILGISMGELKTLKAFAEQWSGGNNVPCS